jgi:hypothetical protein
MRERRNRLIRWLIIVASLALLFPAYYPDPWTPEGAVSETLRGMSIPADTVRAVSVIDTGGLYSVLFYDERHRIYHHFLMDRPFGFLWRNRGGGVGRPFDPDEILQFRWGWHQEDDDTVYKYAVDQVNDPRIHTLTVRWDDGVEQSMQPIHGLYHFARSFAPGQKAAAALYAYDRNGTLLYRLDSDHPVIRRDKQAGGE